MTARARTAVLLGCALAVLAAGWVLGRRPEREGAADAGRPETEVLRREDPPLTGMARPATRAPPEAARPTPTDDDHEQRIDDDGSTQTFLPPPGFTAVDIEACVAHSDEHVPLMGWVMHGRFHNVTVGRHLRGYAKPGERLWIEAATGHPRIKPLRLVADFVWMTVPDPVPERVVFRLPSLDDPRVESVRLLPVLDPDGRDAWAPGAVLHGARWERPLRMPDGPPVLAAEDGSLPVPCGLLRALLPQSGAAWPDLVEGVLLAEHDTADLPGWSVHAQDLELVPLGRPLPVRLTRRKPALDRRSVRLTDGRGGGRAGVRARADGQRLRSAVDGRLELHPGTEVVLVHTSQGSVWDVFSPLDAGEATGGSLPVTLPEVAEVTFEFVPHSEGGWPDDASVSELKLGMFGRALSPEGDPVVWREAPERLDNAGCTFAYARIGPGRPRWTLQVPIQRELQLDVVLSPATEGVRGRSCLCDFVVRPGESHLRFRWPDLGRIEPDAR